MRIYLAASYSLAKVAALAARQRIADTRLANNIAARERSDKALKRWLATGERGLSSDAIAFATMLQEPATLHYPLDPDDLRRCILLIEAVPRAWKVGVKALSDASPHWCVLVQHWFEPESYLREETDKNLRGRASFTYRMMQDIFQAVEVESS